VGTAVLSARGVSPPAGAVAVARVIALVPDLLFGSRVQASLAAADHEVELIGGEGQLRERIADTLAPPAAVLVVDLTDDSLDGAGIVESLLHDGALPGTRTLAFYSHVEASVRERAERAGFDVVVPRSRMAREGAELVTRLAGGAARASD
jgi:DNA-binding NarL/FixJ family response regulator